MKMLTNGYKLASSWEEYGGLGIQIHLHIDRELTDEDRRVLHRAVDDIQDGIERETVKLNPRSKIIREKERAEILALFPYPIYVEEIPNGYCSSACCSQLPWYVITTARGRIKIGWRKRVIQIDWSDSSVKATANALFPNADVTKGDHYIHAWGIGPAADYVKRILESS